MIAIKRINDFFRKIKNSNLISSFKSLDVTFYIVCFSFFALLIYYIKTFHYESLDSFWQGVIVEMTGFLLDIFLLGIGYSYFKKFYQRKEKINHHLNEISFYKDWSTDEGFKRIISHIKELNKLKTGKVDLSNTILDEMDYSGLNLSNSNFSNSDLVNKTLINGAVSSKENEELFAYYFNTFDFKDAKIETINLTNALLIRASFDSDFTIEKSINLNEPELFKTQLLSVPLYTGLDDKRLDKKIPLRKDNLFAHFNGADLIENYLNDLANKNDLNLNGALVEINVLAKITNTDTEGVSYIYRINKGLDEKYLLSYHSEGKITEKKKPYYYL